MELLELICIVYRRSIWSAKLEFAKLQILLATELAKGMNTMHGYAYGENYTSHRQSAGNEWHPFQ